MNRNRYFVPVVSSITHRDVERRIPRPGPSYAVVEVEPVHLGADQMPVDLLLDAPVGRVHLAKPVLPALELVMLPRHGVSGVVWNTVSKTGLSKARHSSKSSYVEKVS